MVAKARVKIDRGIAQQVALKIVTPLVERTTSLTRRAATLTAPYKTGHLAKTYRIGVVPTSKGVTGTVEFTADYAAAVNNGRRALTIRPTSGDPKARLRFEIGKRVIYAKSVTQKARRKNPFLTNALSDVAGRAGFRVIRRDRR